MTHTLLPMFGTLIAGFFLGLLGVVATRSHLFHPAIDPFAPSIDPSADTMTDQAMIQTVFTDDGWKHCELDQLSKVEDLLDSLENCGICHREVQTLGNARFDVRWK